MSDSHLTELDDLDTPAGPPSELFAFVRDARLFARRTLDGERLARGRHTVVLAPDELHRPPVPADVVVRRGRIRVSEFLPDGREVTRAVLQAGSFFRTRPWPGPAGEPGAAALAPAYDLAYVVLMALDDAELWVLPAGALDGLDRPREPQPPAR